MNVRFDFEFWLLENLQLPIFTTNEIITNPCNMDHFRKNVVYLKQVYTFQSNQIKFENPKSSLPLKTFIGHF